MKVLSNKKLQEKIGWSPYYPKRHEPQIRILESRARDKVVDAGTRGGKTIVAAYSGLKELLLDGTHTWIVAPSYELTLKVFRYIEGWIGKAFPSLVSGISYRPFPKIITPWNSWLEGKSAENPTSLLGEELDLLIQDEAARQKREIWERYLFARLTSRKGKSIKISTPWGQNWFYEEWLKAKEKKGAFQFTSKDNPYFPKEEWDRAKEILPETVFQQEFEARFLSDAAAVFRGVDNIVGDCLEDVRAGHYYVMGVDLAQKRDFTVITIIDTLTNKVVFWDRFKDVEYPFQKKRIIASAKRYNYARIIVDSTGVGDPISQDLERDSLCVVDNFRFLGGRGDKKKQLIEKASIFVEQKQVVIPDNKILLDELKSFGYELTAAGRVTYSAPQGLHDDCVISLALAIWGLTSQRIEKPDFFKKIKTRAKETKKIKKKSQYE